MKKTNLTPQSASSEGDTNTSEARQHWINQTHDQKTKDILLQDSRYFLHQAMSTPCLDALTHAKGIYLEDVAGNKYMDFHGNNVHQLGHAHPYVIEKVQQQLANLPFAPRRFTHQVAIDCAAKLTCIAGASLNRVLFAPGGTSVIGMALKLARHITGNAKVISLWDSFHGASLDAISVGGEACFRDNMGPLMPGVERIPPAVSYRGALPSSDGSDVHYADYLEYVIEKEGGVGAFIAEAVRNTDVQVPSQAYWQRVREICDRHNVLLILDDILNGMGRTGHWFSHQYYGIEPDILCIGKGLGAGIVPFAAMITRDEYNTAAHISLGHYTHEKSPIGCAAALAMIEVIERDSLLEKTKQDHEFVKNRLTKLQARYPIIGDVRGIGMLWGIELVSDPIKKTRALAEAEQVMYRCLALGLSFKVSQGNVLQLSPPLIIGRRELSEAIDILEQALSEVSNRQG